MPIISRLYSPLLTVQNTPGVTQIPTMKRTTQVQRIENRRNTKQTYLNRKTKVVSKCLIHCFTKLFRPTWHIFAVSCYIFAKVFSTCVVGLGNLWKHSWTTEIFAVLYSFIRMRSLETECLYSEVRRLLFNASKLADINLLDTSFKLIHLKLIFQLHQILLLVNDAQFASSV